MGGRQGVAILWHNKLAVNTNDLAISAFPRLHPLGGRTEMLTLEPMETFGTRLAKQRESRNLSQVELAAMVGVTKGSISNYERDIHTPTVKTVLLMAEALACSVQYLVIEGYEDPHPQETKILEAARLIGLNEAYRRIIGAPREEPGTGRN